MSTVYVIDRIVTKPGRAQEFLTAYLAEYAPGARERGMVLDRVLVSPPLWFDEQSNTITVTWALAGASGWWAMTWQGRSDPALKKWWDRAAEFVVERTREVAADSTSIAELANV